MKQTLPRSFPRSRLSSRTLEKLTQGTRCKQIQPHEICHLELAAGVAGDLIQTGVVAAGAVGAGDLIQMAMVVVAVAGVGAEAGAVVTQTVGGVITKIRITTPTREAITTTGAEGVAAGRVGLLQCITAKGVQTVVRHRRVRVELQGFGGFDSYNFGGASVNLCWC